MQYEMRMGAVLRIPCVRIIAFLAERGEVRHNAMLEIVGSRGTLWANLRELEDEGLVERRVEAARPIMVFYGLTGKGRRVAEHLGEIEKVLVE